MKKYIRYIFSLLCCIALSTAILITASAHPGRTNADGGHWDYDAGEYHYHHGYPAHDHYDSNGDGIVDCPYDFDDQTGINSYISSADQTDSINSYSSHELPAPSIVYVDKEIIKEVIIVPVWLKCGFAVSWLLVAYLFMSQRKKVSVLQDKLKSQEQFYEQRISELNDQHQKKFEESSMLYQAVIRGKDAYIDKLHKEQNCK